MEECVPEPETQNFIVQLFWLCNFFDKLKQKWGIPLTFDAYGRMIVARSGEP